MKLMIAGVDGQTTNYENAFSNLGVYAFSSLCAKNTEEFDALLLPGGGDIDPFLFGQKNNGSRSIDPNLDRMQLEILSAFIHKKKPVLGICKGLQLINIFFGGTICQDLSTNYLHQYTEGDQVHPTTSHPGSCLASLYGQRFFVNSAHHQGIEISGKDLICIQTADDGVAEAMIHNTLPVLGVQWHPERMCFAHIREDTVNGELLLSYFLTLLR